MNKRILRLAIPNIISNITVPLLGLVDLSIVGHLGNQSYIGAIAIGGMMFNLLYWNFGFLRMGTSGLTAQAFGKRDFKETTAVLTRSLSVGLGISLLLLLLQHPLRHLIFHFLDSGEEVKYYASLYFHIGIAGAPALLALYSFKGWFIGMQNSHFPMYIAIAVNCINIACSLIFVYLLGKKVEGVAWGTVIAQWSGLLIAIVLWFTYYCRFKRYVQWKESLKIERLKAFFAINRDLFLRTLCLIAVTTFFTSTGASYNDTILAVNTLLMQLFTLFSYIMDGFAFAGEALCGRYIGAGNRQALSRSIMLLFQWGTLLSLLFTLLYYAGGARFLGLLTNDVQVLATTMDYFYWTLAIPLCGFAAFLWDGIFIGATAGKEMRTAMFVATATFFFSFYLLREGWGNHALWFSFLLYLILRGVVQTLLASKAVFKKIR